MRNALFGTTLILMSLYSWMALAQGADDLGEVAPPVADVGDESPAPVVAPEDLDEPAAPVEAPQAAPPTNPPSNPTSAAVAVEPEEEGEHADVESIDLAELLGIPLEYGFDEVAVAVHVYLVTALWNLQDQAFGSFANAGGGFSGKPQFVTYSGYVNIRGNVTDTLMAEAEFELYKGQDGATKVTRLRGVWKPSPYFQLALGRDFPPIGIQDRVYYPTSDFRLFAHAPYLYHAIIRATGWWDAGVHLSGYVPLPFIEDKAKLKLAASIINGPGDAHQSADDYLQTHITTNEQGYMWEAFHDKARQPWDNNSDKPIAFRVAFSFFDELELGASAMFAKYDANDKLASNYFFGHLLYGGERLTVAAEAGMLKLDVEPANMQSPANAVNETTGDTGVTQFSTYVSAGYKVIYDMWGLEFIEPVVRYEFMDSWMEDATNKGDRHAIWLGLRASPIKGWTIKAAYLIQLETASDADFNGDGTVDPATLENDGLIIESVFQF